MPWTLASMYIPALVASAPVSGLRIVITLMSRPSTLLPSDDSVRNFGKARCNRSMSATSSS